MFIHIISDCIFLFPTHVGKLLPLFSKKENPGFKSETGISDIVDMINL